MTAHSARVPLDHGTVRGIVLGIMLAMFLSALDQTIVATALATIGRSYANVADLSWVVTAYLLAATVATPLYGKLSDIHGRRPVLLGGVALFVLGSVACALSPTMPALIVSRALQGLGGGGLIAMAQTIVGDAVPPRERGRYQGYFGAVFASATIAGPVLGGIFAEHLHWTLIFWINVPLGILAFAVSAHALKALPRHERPHKLDVLGGALMVTGAIALLLALNWGGVRYPWSSPQILGLAAAAVVLFALFGWRIAYAPEPFVPLAILRNDVVAAAVASAAFAYGTMIGLSIFTPIYFETVLGQSASGSGLTLIPFMGGVVVGSTIAGRMMSWLTHYKRLSVFGLPVAFAALLPLALVPAQLSTVAVGALLMLTGMGIGTVLPITTVSVQNAVLPYQLGTATGLTNFVRALASALIVALYGAILFGGVSGRGVSLETIAAGAGRDAASAHFHWIFGAAATCLAISWLFMLMMEERPLRVGVHAADDAMAVPAE